MSDRVIGLAIEVHRSLGPGLLESAYEACLSHELRSAEITFRRQVPLPVHYKALRLDCGYRIDLLIADQLIVELKTVETILPIHKAQLLTYLRMSHRRVGLILNFNTPVLRDGVCRMVL